MMDSVLIGCGFAGIAIAIFILGFHAVLETYQEREWVMFSVMSIIMCAYTLLLIGVAIHAVRHQS